MAVRLERELLQAIDAEASGCGLNRSEFIREMLAKAVDPAVLNEAAEREQVEAIRRAWAADEKRLRSAVEANMEEPPPRPKWLSQLDTGEAVSLREAFAEGLEERLSSAE